MGASKATRNPFRSAPSFEDSNAVNREMEMKNMVSESGRVGCVLLSDENPEEAYVSPLYFIFFIKLTRNTL